MLLLETGEEMIGGDLTAQAVQFAEREGQVSCKFIGAAITSTLQAFLVEESIAVRSMFNSPVISPLLLVGRRVQAKVFPGLPLHEVHMVPDRWHFFGRSCEGLAASKAAKR